MADRKPSLFDFGPVAAAYDRWYETAEGQARDTAQRATVLTLLPRPKPGERLLELGCGTGHWSQFFAEQGYEVFGLDVSPQMLAVARSRHYPRCHFEMGDACRLPAGTHAYRVVAAMTSLEFVRDQAGAIAGMVRNTAPGGTVLVGTLNRLAPLNRERVERGEAPYASAHLLSPVALRDLLRPYGRVRMAGADTRPNGSGYGVFTVACGCLRLHHGCSAAPFLAAAVHPLVQEKRTMRTGHPRWAAAMALPITATVSAGLLEQMGIDSEASRVVREQDYRPDAVGRPPARHSGSEGVPPLPSSAVPPRRTEKRSPPRPPVRIAELATEDRVDWAASPHGTDTLLAVLARPPRGARLKPRAQPVVADNGRSTPHGISARTRPPSMGAS